MKGRRVVAVLNVLAWSLAGLLAYARWVEPNWVVVERAKMPVSTVDGEKEPLRVVHLADLHASQVGFRERRLIRIVNELDPDLVLVTGDVAQFWSDVGAAKTVLESFEARRGVYATLGDADYSNHRGHCSYCHEQGSLREGGFRIVRNDSLVVEFPNGTIEIGGVDDPAGPYAHRIPRPTSRGETFKILMLSSPEDYDTATGSGYDLILTGDTHGGQVKWLGDLLRGESACHSILNGSPPMLINSGIGTNMASFRFGVRPRVTVIDLDE